MTDGWHAASTLLGWTLGALPALFLLGVILTAVVIAGAAAVEWIRHQLEVRRVRRLTRRSGRTVGAPGSPEHAAVVLGRATRGDR